MQGLKTTKPAVNDPLTSAPMRLNFAALASQNAGVLPPSDPGDGWFWLDTSDPTAYDLYVYIAGTWFPVLTNLQGGPPSQNSPGKYEHLQGAASLSWIVQHDLNKSSVSVCFWNLAGLQIFPDTVTMINSNRVVATFLVAQSGRAVVIG